MQITPSGGTSEPCDIDYHEMSQENFYNTLPYLKDNKAICAEIDAAMVLWLKVSMALRSMAD